MAKTPSGLFQFKVPDEVVGVIRSLHPDLKRKIKMAFKIIINNPDAGKSLRDELIGLKSFRVGRLRILYRIKGRNIEIVAIGPRRNIYQETYRLLR
ncbi:MAG: type II toxin-antitoxin system RelE/ParE family toxin [Thermodesulfobacteriota bacterium]